MKFLSVCFGLVVLLTSLAAGQDEADPYSLGIVRDALAARTGGRMIIRSWSQKHLTRLGDCVSVAILKLLDERQLSNAETIREIMPLIRNAFSEPSFIALGEDRNPKVTLFLLAALQQSIADAQTQEEVRRTREYVLNKTGG